jgi:hypothetical protein
MERTFFDAAPPEEPGPLPDHPRAFAAARGQVERAWRSTALFVRAAGVNAWAAARAGAARLVAALSRFRVDRRRVAFASAGAIMAAGLTAGSVALRQGVVTSGATPARPAPVAVASAAPRANARSSAADAQAPRADASKRRQHAHRKPSSSGDRGTHWARAPQSSAPLRPSRPFFSR